MKVLVLDVTHGGDVISLAYARRGDSVTAVDIYGTSSPEMHASLEAGNVEFMESAPDADFDLGIAPIHCPDRYYGKARCAERISHHLSVGQLANFPFPVVEVTGTGGKTSTCQLLARILADRGHRVLLLTSGGLHMVEWSGIRVLQENVSIAPSTILKLAGEGHQADVGVFEVSLGGTGLATVGVITTIGNDYAIAGGTRRAFDGKSQMIRYQGCGHLSSRRERECGALRGTLCPTDDLWRRGDVNVSLSELRLGKGTRLRIAQGNDVAEAVLASSYLAPTYMTAFGAAAAAALGLGVPLDAIADTLSRFRGAPGRGEVHMTENGVLIRERNPGVSANSIEWGLQALDEYGCSDVGVVVDPVNAKVCEKLDLADVRKAVDMHPAVRGLYLLAPEGWSGAHEGFKIIFNTDDVDRKHAVTMWCTKEGYL